MTVDPIIVAVGVFIVGLTCSSGRSLLAAGHRLAEERKLLDRARQALFGVTSEQMLTESEPARWLLQRCRLLEERERSSVIARRILRMGGLARTRLPGEQILTHLLSRGEDLQPQHPRFVASVLVFIALLGTLASIASAVSALPSFNVVNADLSPLDNVVQHLRSVFIITGIGILATVVVAWWNHRFTQGQETFLVDLEEFSLDVLAPLLLGHPELVEIHRVEALQRDMLRATEHMSAVVADVGTSLSASMEQMQVSAEARAQQFQSTLLEGATQFSTQVQEASKGLVTASTRMCVMSEQVATDLPQAIKATCQLVELVTGAASGMENSSQQLEGTLKNLCQSVDTLPGQLGTLEAVCHRIGQTVETFRGEQTSVRNDLQETMLAWQRVAEQLRALKDTMQQTYQLVDQSLEKTCSGFEARQHEFSDALRGVSAAAQQNVHALGQMQQEMLEGVGARFEVAADKQSAETLRTQQAVCRQWEQFMNDATPALSEMGRAAGDLQQTMQVVRQVSEGHQLTELARMLQALPESVTRALGNGALSSDLRHAAQALRDAANAPRNNGDGALAAQFAQLNIVLGEVRDVLAHGRGRGDKGLRYGFPWRLAFWRR